MICVRHGILVLIACALASSKRAYADEESKHRVDLNSGLNFHLNRYFMHASSEATDEGVHMFRFTYAFTVHQLD